MKVAVVDDDLWVRLGRAAALSREPGIEVVEMDPHSAVEFGVGWAEIDVALVDAHDESEPFDRFPGVHVVEEIRRHDELVRTQVVVISGHCENVFLRLRMAEAGADYFYDHEDVRDLESLITAIRSPTTSHRVVFPDASDLAKVGLRPGARPNAALHYLEVEGLDDAFVMKQSLKALELSRRSVIRIRREVARLGGLKTMRPTGPSRNLIAPEWRAVVDFVDRARGLERRQGPAYQTDDGGPQNNATG
jgi:DNA-binding NarL/FixJ family response regulator